MKKDELKKKWLAEGNESFSGWNFSYLGERWQGEGTPWDYTEIVKSYLKEETVLLDMGTGGGEFLLSLNHPFSQTSATEGWLPNFELLMQTLTPLGINVKFVEEDERLPFPDEFFDLVINRHDYFDLSEVYRVLKPGGVFITQQVGGTNNQILIERLMPNPNLAINNTLGRVVEEAIQKGMSVLIQEESRPSLKFFDVGAFVYFAHQIPWEFPDFSVADSFETLLEFQKEVEEKGYLESVEDRFVILAQKK